MRCVCDVSTPCLYMGGFAWCVGCLACVSGECSRRPIPENAHAHPTTVSPTWHRVYSRVASCIRRYVRHGTDLWASAGTVDVVVVSTHIQTTRRAHRHCSFLRGRAAALFPSMVRSAQRMAGRYSVCRWQTRPRQSNARCVYT